VQHRRPADRDAEVLPDKVATRLLARASELDAAGAKVSDLRAAAAEAGISTRAFDEALAELEEEQVPDVSVLPPRRSRMWMLAAGVAALIAIFAIGRTFPPAASGTTAPMIEEAIQLRCLSAGQAAALIRPHLNLRTNTIVYSAGAPGVLTIRATAAQIQNVKSVLDQYESSPPGSPACASTAGQPQPPQPAQPRQQQP